MNMIMLIIMLCDFYNQAVYKTAFVSGTKYLNKFSNQLVIY